MQDATGTQEFQFRGQAKEWFGIWIVNLLLSIVTLGIYSAWAKVRTKKYFYNNTYVAGRNFDYHATGKQILIGRIIVVIAFVAISLLSAIPFVNILVLVGFLVFFPWLIVRAMMFNARMSSFSNVRFNFVGKKMRAWVVYLGYPIGIYIGLAVLGGGAAYMGQQGSFVLASILGVLAVLMLFAFFPFVDRAIKDYTISNHLLGTSKFDMEAPLGPFLKATLASAAWAIVAGLVAGAALGGLAQFGSLFSDMGAGREPTAADLGVIGLLYLMFFIVFLPAAFIYQAIVRNVVYNNTTLGGKHRFMSDVSPIQLLWIAVTNMIIVICTLGLMLPWAQIRIAKYLANHTHAVIDGSLDDFIGGEQEATTALGDAYSDLEGIDVGLPI
jgi:uncharacterized membrane protein YjgN (DUF898 family)